MHFHHQAERFCLYLCFLSLSREWLMGYRRHRPQAPWTLKCMNLSFTHKKVPVNVTCTADQSALNQ